MGILIVFFLELSLDVDNGRFQELGDSFPHDGADILPFLHDVTLASLDGTVYEAWYNSTSAEICGSSLIRGRFSSDGGLNWSDPFCVVGEMSEAEEHFVPADLFAHNGRLYALITTMSGKNMTVDLQLFRKREDPMEKWEFLGRVAPGILCNTPPQKMDNGNYIVGDYDTEEKAAAANGIRVVPFFVIEGYGIPGVIEVEQYKEALRDALKQSAGS